MENGYLLILILICALIMCAMVGYILEYRRYNGGICPKCGHALRYFDTASDGSRGYICDECGYDAWVSYDLDKDRIK